MKGLGALLERFPARIASYEGSGTLRFASERTIAVRFAAAQLVDGTNVILCEHSGAISAPADLLSASGALHFEGEASHGLALETKGKLWPQGFPGTIPESWGVGPWSGYSPQHLWVRARQGTATEIRYGLTNVRPPGVERLPLHLSSNGGATEAELVRVPDHRIIFDRVKIFRGTAVTCELVFSADAISRTDVEQVVRNVSYLLSIAQGCKIEWIYREERDGQGLLIREHALRKTKPYSPLAPVDLRAPAATREFLESTYAGYVRRRDDWALHLGPIDAYLEAKAETDLLETRAAKLAVALEALKHHYLRSREASVSEFLLNEESFALILPDLQSAAREIFKKRSVDRDIANSMAAKLQGINRQSFSRVVRHLARDVGLELSSEEEQRFIDSRNTLLHQGQFYCRAVAKGEAARRSEPMGSQAEEYLFMVNVLDRLFLKLIGYSGEYVDWRLDNRGKLSILT